MKFSRREFLKTAMMAGGVLALGGAGSLIRPRTVYAAATSPLLTKWAQAMRGLGPAGIPVLNSVADPAPAFAGAQYYQVTAGEFTDLLHPNLSAATQDSGGTGTPPTQYKRHLGGVIIANRGTPVRIRFTNTLPPTHIIPVDTTLPGANQAQNRMAIHIHGGLVPWISDGGPFDWWAPDGSQRSELPEWPGKRP